MSQAAGMLLAAAAIAGCAAPISTLRSPAHPRVVEVRNATREPRLLLIEPAAAEALGASFTFTGVLRPGEVKTLYVYDGFEYRFRLVDATGHTRPIRQAFAVDGDLGLAFAGDSLVPEENPRVEVGTPVAVAAYDARERIRLKNGEPDRRLARTLATGTLAPYEVWVYYATGYKYVFLDELRTGRYVLLTTTDPEEPGRPDWERRLPAEAVEEILRE